MNKLVLVASFIFLSSCSSYISRVHNQIDNAYDKKYGKKDKKREPSESPFYRRTPNTSYGQDKRPLENPKTYSRFSNQRRVEPRSERSYRPQNQNRRRYTASDLQDNNPNEESLWAGKGRENYLFSSNDIKRPGDIVIVQVKKNLKDAISNELKRAFPKRNVASKKKNDKGEKDDKKETAAESTEQDKEEAGNEEATGLDGKVYDKISSQIVKDVSNDYFSINGVKEVLFRKNKHMIRIQAVVPKKAIGEDDSISSDQLLDSQVFVLR